MLPLEEMLFRVLLGMALGAVIGLERELAGKEAGVRTNLIVSGGAAIFSIAALSLPYIVAQNPIEVPDILARNGGYMTMIGNIVVGIGFLGAGIIIKHEMRVVGLTTAATIWFAAATGMLAGIGLKDFALIVGIGAAFLLEILRRVDVIRFRQKRIHKEKDKKISKRKNRNPE